MKCFLKLGTLLVVIWLAIPAEAQEGTKSAGLGKRSTLTHGDIKEQQKPQTPADDPYVIGAEDVLDIYVWKENDLSRSLAVRPDGKISLPLVNDIQAAGLTPTQLAVLITIQLKSYVTNPQVTVMVKTINSRRVYVLGQVNKPGGITLLPHMTVLQAISSVGGLNQYANQKRIYVMRNAGGQQIRFPSITKLPFGEI
jgi:polysaccharide export outer membrane protein